MNKRAAEMQIIAEVVGRAFVLFVVFSLFPLQLAFGVALGMGMELVFTLVREYIRTGATDVNDADWWKPRGWRAEDDD